MEHLAFSRSSPGKKVTAFTTRPSLAARQRRRWRQLLPDSNPLKELLRTANEVNGCEWSQNSQSEILNGPYFELSSKWGFNVERMRCCSESISWSSFTRLTIGFMVIVYCMLRWVYKRTYN